LQGLQEYVGGAEILAKIQAASQEKVRRTLEKSWFVVFRQSVAAKFAGAREEIGDSETIGNVVEIVVPKESE
jgi:hypothetical protein